MWDWPAKLTDWAEFLANLATILGVLAISVTVRISLKRIELAQLRAAEAIEATIPGRENPFAVGSEGITLFAAIMNWAGASTYGQGLGAQEYRQLPNEQKRQYRVWVGCLLRFFDMAMRDPSIRTEDSARRSILLEIKKHHVVIDDWLLRRGGMWIAKYEFHPTFRKLLSGRS